MEEGLKSLLKSTAGRRSLALLLINLQLILEENYFLINFSNLNYKIY